MWSMVISSTDGRDRMRSRPYAPLPSIIRPKASRSSAVETSPPPPDSKTGGRAKVPVPASCRTTTSPVEQVPPVAGREPVRASPPAHGSRCPSSRAARRCARGGTPPATAGDPGDQHPQDLAARVVQPALAGLMREREAAQALHELVGRDGERPLAQGSRASDIASGGGTSARGRPVRRSPSGT